MDEGEGISIKAIVMGFLADIGGSFAAMCGGYLSK